MIDKKVYKTDYQSEFTDFFKTLPADEVESIAVTAEKAIFSKINKLRDNSGNINSRNKLWEGF